MLAALIPPKGLESYALASNFHLALPIRATMHNDRYVSTYQDAAARGDYIVMDNGAADGGLVTTSRLLEAAMALGAKEVVAPDSLFGTANTLALVKKFLVYFEYFEEDGRQERFKIQAAAQGRDLDSFMDCIAAYAEEPLIKVVGLPKHMLTTLDSSSARIDMANWIAEEFPNRFEIHMLGTNPVWIDEIKAIQTYAPHVRSVDSALAFNYAIMGEDLVTTKREILRHPDYFRTNWARISASQLVLRNVRTYMEWAGASVLPPEEAKDNFNLRPL